MPFLALLLMALTLLAFTPLLISSRVLGHDDGHPVVTPMDEWAIKQQVMPAARKRMSCQEMPVSCSCCNGAEIVRPKYRVANDKRDAWDWFNTFKGKWERIPDDIVHWGQPTPDKRAVLFLYPAGTDNPRCFFPPQQEGG